MFEFKRSNSNGAGGGAGLLVNSGSVLDNPLAKLPAQANVVMQGMELEWVLNRPVDLTIDLAVGGTF